MGSGGLLGGRLGEVGGSEGGSEGVEGGWGVEGSLGGLTHTPPPFSPPFCRYWEALLEGGVFGGGLLGVLMSPPPFCRYWEALLELLWPRFEHILELNIHSIQSTDPQKLGSLDTRPHYVIWGGGFVMLGGGMK